MEDGWDGLGCNPSSGKCTHNNKQTRALTSDNCRTVNYFKITRIPRLNRHSQNYKPAFIAIKVKTVEKNIFDSAQVYERI
jgi:hypothetical protein